MDTKQPAIKKILVAVSGGVDSVVMLDWLAHNDEQELVVAHFDHAMRSDSAADARFVEALAAQYGFNYFGQRARGNLDSEADARHARWEFLRQVKRQACAGKIATGHHQDDVLETMIFNCQRGTNRRGLVTLRETTEILRPLLDWSKSQIYEYATTKGLEYVEDSTNTALNFARNRIRHQIMPHLGTKQQQELLSLRQKLTTISDRIDAEAGQLAEKLTDDTFIEIDRSSFRALPKPIQRECLAHLLRRQSISYGKETLVRVADAIEQSRSNSLTDVTGGWYIRHSAEISCLIAE